MDTASDATDSATSVASDPVGGSETSTTTGASTDPTSDPSDPTYDPDPDTGDCSNGALYFGPNELPLAYLGEAYAVDLFDYADEQFYGVSYSGSSPVPGLEIDDETLEVSGTPTQAGEFTIYVTAYHAAPGPGECSTHPDDHTFTLVVSDEESPDTETGTGGSTGGSTGG